MRPPAGASRRAAPLHGTLSRAREPSDVLFESCSVEHIREVHRRTAREIGDKQARARPPGVVASAFGVRGLVVDVKDGRAAAA